MDTVAEGAMSVKDAIAFSGFKKTKLYEAIKTGELPACRDGKSIVIPRRALQRFLAERLRT